MKTKEKIIEINNLQKKINDMRTSIDISVYNYLSETVGIVSVNNTEMSDDIIGKAVAEEFHWYWNREIDKVTICYTVFRNKYGDFSDDEKEVNVSYSELDKYNVK